MINILQALKYHLYSAKRICQETERVYLVDNYTVDAPKICKSLQPQVISMIDGRYIHGGFTDRIRGILAAYKWAKEKGYAYKINWTYPYNLSDYLKPNKVDWEVSPEQISFNQEEACPVAIFDYKMPYQWHIFNRIMNSRIVGNYKQYHVYSNIDGLEGEYKKLFNELFVPSSDIRENINHHLSFLGDHYVSFTFRFQELLGDFKEKGKWITLNEKDRYYLIDKCISVVRNEYYKKGLKGMVLVTSDSSSFLSEISKVLDFVYVIPGQISHMDYKEGKEDYDVNMRSFIDFFLLAKASSSYLVCCDKMYRSNFAKYASIYGEHEYHEIIRK